MSPLSTCSSRYSKKPVWFGDERQAVGKDVAVESPAGIAHRWINESDALFRVLVVKMLTIGKGTDTGPL